MAPLMVPLGGFADPARRPRWIVWTIVTVILFAGIMIPVLGVTSTRWFCSEGCHKVQDDTIKAYQHSSHAEISCMSCHMPVDANPIVFMLHKVTALGELAQTVTNTYRLPLNGQDEVALTMKSEQCTQCHNEALRKVTPDPGLKIDHAIHLQKGVDCTICHNRIAHKEDFALTLIDPKSRNQNQKHPDFMLMSACFRCHTQEVKRGAPTGQCFVCHTPGFTLVPASHRDPGFFPKGHGQLAAHEESRAPWINAQDAGGEAGSPAKGETLGQSLKKVGSINLCSTCHSRAFCTDCHGVPMPHPSDFAQRHGPLGTSNPQLCAKCHGLTGVAFCNNCHHGTHLGYQIDPAQTWTKQHPVAVTKVGAAGCIQPGGCHSPTYCAICHANGGKLPPGAPKL